MCEFCTEHGEGKKWYLLMENFSDELLHHELSSVQKEMVGASTRAEWRKQGMEGLLRKAEAVSGSKNSTAGAASPAQNLSEDELLEKSKATHFGKYCQLKISKKYWIWWTR